MVDITVIRLTLNNLIGDNIFYNAIYEHITWINVTQFIYLKTWITVKAEISIQVF